MVEVLLTEEPPAGYSLWPEHPLWGFPCTEFGNFAGAEVVPRDAECVLDATELVQNKRVHCLDDLILASERTHA